MTDLTATQLSERLGVTRSRALDLLRTETITGRQLANGTWLADSDAVARYEVSARRCAETCECHSCLDCIRS